MNTLDLFNHIAQSVSYQDLESHHSISLTVKRLDQIHPHISGNKFFKLKYNFSAAQQQGLHQVLTFGGAYSNHIAATAYAAHLCGFNSVGIIRGEELADKTLNRTLALAQQFGMQLHFISREKYRQKDQIEYLSELQQEFPQHFLIPEGGTNSCAIQGCQEILSSDDLKNYDVICCAVGTGGTLAGLIEASAAHQKVIGFSALKGDFLKNEISKWTTKTNWMITDAYSGAGYAKTNPKLLDFIQWFETKYGIPVEQIYTAKMLQGVFDFIHKDYFPAHSRVLVIHTGGLQGKFPTQINSEIA